MDFAVRFPVKSIPFSKSDLETLTANSPSDPLMWMVTSATAVAARKRVGMIQRMVVKVDGLEVGDLSATESSTQVISRLRMTSRALRCPRLLDMRETVRGYTDTSGVLATWVDDTKARHVPHVSEMRATKRFTSKWVILAVHRKEAKQSFILVPQTFCGIPSIEQGRCVAGIENCRSSLLYLGFGIRNLVFLEAFRLVGRKRDWSSWYKPRNFSRDHNSTREISIGTVMTWTRAEAQKVIVPPKESLLV